jgi:hypothetical protein
VFTAEAYLKNLVFFGDGLLCPPEGYGEAVVELFVTRHPGAAFKSFHLGEERLSLEAALGLVPALIGKAPELTVIGLGAADMNEGHAPEPSLEKLAALVQVLLSKTQTRVAVTTVCAAFLSPVARVAAAEFNAGVRMLPGTFPGGERVSVLDLDAAVDAFLDAHRRGVGEKRSLHASALRPTSMGRVFLSNTVYALLGGDSLLTA